MPTTCDDEKRPSNIAAMLERVPRSDGEALPLNALCPSANTAGADCAACATAVMTVLRVFDAVQVADGTGGGRRVKAVSETSLYFLRSLAAYVRSSLKLTTNWEREGATDVHALTRALSSGAQLLYLMERRRTQECGDMSPTRVVHVSQAFIVARIRGTRRPVFLMQYDDKAQRYQLIGGRKRSSDPDARAVMVRELEEELAPNQLKCITDFEVKELLSGLVLKELSRTYGAYTEYHFTIFHAVFHRERLKLGPADRWVSYEELMSGKTRDGVPLITSDGSNYFADIDRRISSQWPGGLRRLPLSLAKPQHIPLRQIWRERKWQIIVGVGLLVLGLFVRLLWRLLSPALSR